MNWDMGKKTHHYSVSSIMYSGPLANEKADQSIQEEFPEGRKMKSTFAE